MDNLNPFMLKSFLEIVVWVFDIFDSLYQIIIKNIWQHYPEIDKKENALSAIRMTIK